MGIDIDVDIWIQKAEDIREVLAHTALKQT